MKRCETAAMVMGLLLFGGVSVGEQSSKQAGEKPGVTVKELKFCTGVEERQPKGVGTSFPSDIGKLWCWTLITGATEDTDITHVWWYGKKPMASVTLSIRSARFRTWSRKTIMPAQVGTWTLKVTDHEGRVLKEASVTIEKKSDSSLEEDR